MKGKKMIIVLIILAIVAVVTILILRKRKNNSSSSNSSGNRTSSGNSGNSSSGGSADTFPLRKGSRGDKVKTIQKMANLVSGNDALLAVDGIWGVKTDAAVKQYLATDGSISSGDWETLMPMYNNLTSGDSSLRAVALVMARKNLPL